jgi:hypothetical protein
MPASIVAGKLSRVVSVSTSKRSNSGFERFRVVRALGAQVGQWPIFALVCEFGVCTDPRVSIIAFSRLFR